jgi:hypothetical protein
MRTFVFLLEEPSAADLLRGLLPRLLPSTIAVKYLIFEGKQDLENQLSLKLRHWRQPGSSFIVLRDQDSAPCTEVKSRLRDLASRSGRPNILVRVACKELESWILGDWEAISVAFGRPELRAQSVKAIYRNPDGLGNPVHEIRKHIPDYQKRDGARRIGPLLDPARNHSVSFRVFCQGIRRLVDLSPS